MAYQEKHSYNKYNAVRVELAPQEIQFTPSSDKLDDRMIGCRVRGDW